MFFASRLLEINKFYNYSKRPKGYSPYLWNSDEFLSHRGIPNNVGYYKYTIGDSIFGRTDLRFDSLGYRTVADNQVAGYDTLNLFLGCSFTFGDFITAEDGYPYKVSKLLNHNLINAGGPGYGISQIKQEVDSLLGKYEFNYVFIQLSHWLSDRAMRVNLSTHYGYLASAYYSDSGNSFSLNYPAYKSRIYTIKDWSDSRKSYLEKIIFFFVEGLKIEVLDYLSYRLALIKMRLGFLPSPTRNKLELEKYFYSYVIDKVKEHGATPIILKLRYPDEDCYELIEHIEGEAKIVDLDLALYDVVHSTGQEYGTLFHIYHLHKGVKLYYDTHPNAYANDIITNQIINKLKIK